ncbi:uncharacterized protein ACJ7VT_018283 [Polymixia lowei]
MKLVEERLLPQGTRDTFLRAGSLCFPCLHGVIMTKAALTKLVILMIIAVLICLPEFFPSQTVSRVNVLCVPYRPVEEGDQVKAEERFETKEAGVRRRTGCDPCLTPGSDIREPVCTQGNWSTRREPGSDSGSTGDPGVGWFMCEMEVDMEHLNSLSGPQSSLEVSVEVHLGETGSKNLTLHGLLNHSSLHLHPPPAEEEEEKEMDTGQRAFYCCFTTPPTSKQTNHSLCLLHLPNQTVLTATEKEKLPWKRTPKDEWWCVFRVLWLALLCLVLLTILSTVLGQVCRGRWTKKPKVYPVNGYYHGSHLNGPGHSLGKLSAGEMYAQMTNPKGIVPRSFGSRYWPGLAPIQEVETPCGEDTMLDGEVDYQSYDITGGYNAQLHHRGHPPVSSLTEELA